MNNIIKKNTKISNAIRFLNISTIKTLIVLNKKKILGTITDGDIRRGLIRKININSIILKILNRKPFTTQQTIFTLKLKKIMLKKKINCLPIVSKNKIYLGQHNINDKVIDDNNKDTLVVIMAGGKGKRLAPITNEIPKPLIKINNKAMIEHIVAKFLKEGFKNIVISSFYKSNMIKQYFKKKNYYSKINFYREKKPMGTIGSLSQINLKKYKNCILSNADILGNFSPKEILNYHTLNNSDLTVSTYLKKINSSYGKLMSKGKMIHKITEKPSYFENIAIGLYVFKTKILSYLKKGKKIDTPDFINKIINLKKSVMSFPIHEEWIDVGTKENLRLAKIKFKKKIFK